MTDEVGASPYRRVLERPTSLAARRALAEHWRATGDPRAELVDKQLALRQHRLDGTLWTDEANALDRAIYVLVKKHGAAWAGAIAREKLVSGYAFHRGCLAEVTATGPMFLACGERLASLAPIQHLNLVRPFGDLDALVRSPLLARLTSLDVSGCGAGFGDAHANALASSPHLRGLRWLGLFDDGVGRAGVEALVASPHLANLAYVAMAGNPCNPTASVSSYEGITTAGRPAVADDLERTFGPRAWLAVPSDTERWPPHRDDVSIEP